MKINIIADFTKNGKDMNEPHIVRYTDDVYLAAQIVKYKLEKEGCIVQALTVIEGDWTLEQLHDIAHYGKYSDKVSKKLLFASEKTLEYMAELRTNPAAMEACKQELADRMASRT